MSASTRPGWDSPEALRYRCGDGLPGRERAFLACSFWLAHALALAGRLQEAREVFGGASLGIIPEAAAPTPDQVRAIGRALAETRPGRIGRGPVHFALHDAAAVDPPLGRWLEPVPVDGWLLQGAP